MKTSKILEKALRYIRKGWTQNAFARNKSYIPVVSTAGAACSWCSSGAILRATRTGLGGSYSECEEYVLEATREYSIASWNDSVWTTKHQVIEAFKNAIKLAKKDEKNV